MDAEQSKSDMMFAEARGGAILYKDGKYCGRASACPPRHPILASAAFDAGLEMSKNGM